jgi:hypothetical protein
MEKSSVKVKVPYEMLRTWMNGPDQFPSKTLDIYLLTCRKSIEEHGESVSLHSDACRVRKNAAITGVVRAATQLWYHAKSSSLNSQKRRK